MAGFTPLEAVLPFWPDDLLGDRQADLPLGIQQFDTLLNETSGELSVTGQLVWLDVVRFELGMLPGFAVRLLHGGTATVVPFEVTFAPDVLLTISNLGFALELKTDLLVPVERQAGVWTPVLSSTGQPEPLALTMQGLTVTADLEGNLDVAGDTGIDLGAVAIGDSGLVLDLQGVRPHLSRTAAPPAGAPPGFRGLTIETAELHLPDDFQLPLSPDRLTLEGLMIGPDGLSGSVRGSWDPVAQFDEATNAFSGDGAGTLFGVPFALRSLELDLKQNLPVAFTVAGDLALPFFEQLIGVEVHIGTDGALEVVLSQTQPLGVVSEDGLVKFTRPGVLEMTLRQLRFAVGPDGLIAELAGTITPLIGDVEWPAFEVQALSIDSKGSIRIEGGWIDLPDQYSVNFHGFQFEVTRLGLGRADDGARWLGLNGALALPDGIPAGVSAEGLRISWYRDGRTAMSFEGIGVELEIDEVLRFKGAIAYRKQADSHRFDGRIKLQLIALDLEIDAKLVVGRQDGHAFFAIYLGVELPAGIPLFATGLALYGMAGLYADQMEPDRAPDQAWYSLEPGRSWYHAGAEPGVSDLTKWRPQPSSMALGAGVTIGTAPDNGYAFNGRLLFVIVFPGPIILLEGRANILRDRARLSDEPIFKALAVLDGREGSFFVGIDAEYRFDDTGALLDIRAGAEAYYSFSDPTGWHLYLGQKEPKERRIAARLYSIFDATAYYMLDARSLQLGAGVGIDERHRIGPLAMELEVRLDVGADVSWYPPHFFGEIFLLGRVEISAFGFGLGIAARAHLAADIFDPFHIIGELSVALSLPWPLGDIEAEITLEWGPEPEAPALPLPLAEVAVEHQRVTTSWPLPRGGAAALLRPDFDADRDGLRDEGDGAGDPVPSGLRQSPPNLSKIPVVPLDARPQLTFSRSMNDDALIGVNAGEGGDDLDPGWEWIGDPTAGEGPVRARYSLREVALERFVPEAAADLQWQAAAKTPPAAGQERLFGSWAPLPRLPLGETNDDGDPPTGQTKLWLWSKNPFDYTRRSGRAWQEWFDGAHATYPCPTVPRSSVTCYDFKRLPRGPLRDVVDTGATRRWSHPRHDGLTLEWRKPVVLEDRGLIQPARTGRGIATGTGTEWTEALEGRVLEISAVDGQFTIEQVLGPRQLRLDRALTFRAGRPYRVVESQPENFGPRVVAVRGVQGVRRGLELLAQLQASGRHLIVALPESFMQLTVRFSSKHADVGVAGVSEDGRLLDWVDASDLAPDANLRIVLNGDGLRRLEFWFTPAVSVAEDRAFTIHDVCGIAVLPEIEQRRRELAQHVAEQTDHWRAREPVLEAHTVYRLRIETKVEAQGEGPLAGYEDNFEQTEFAYFRTEGPPGLTRLEPPIGHPNPEEFESGLDDLTAYVRQTTPATVPPPGQEPVLPRPFYRGYDVAVEFNANYTSMLFRKAGHDLGLYLQDANDRPARDEEGRLIGPALFWNEARELELEEHDERWVTILQSRDCVDIRTNEIVRNEELVSAAEERVLEPEALYRAELRPALLAEDFIGYPVGSFVEGPAGHGLLGDWEVNDQGDREGPSRWEVREEGNPPSRYIVQTSNLFGGDPNRPDVERPGTMLLRGDPAWSDYGLQAFLRSGDNDGIGLVFRYLDAENFYRFSMDRQRNQRRLIRSVGGAFLVLAEDTFAYELDRDYLIAVHAIGSEIRVYQDGELIFDVADASQPGRIGLYAWGNTDARFSHVRVDDFGAEAPVVYSFGFVTSRFRNFEDHLQSYGRECWRTLLVSDSPLPLAAAPTIAARSGPLDRLAPLGPVGEEEGRAFEALAAELLDAPPSNSLSGVQISRIERAIIFSAEVTAITREGLALTDTEFATAPGAPNNTGELTAGDGQSYWVHRVGPDADGTLIHHLETRHRPMPGTELQGRLDHGLPLGFLLLSPEPIDWRRTVLTVSRAGHPHGSTTVSPPPRFTPVEVRAVRKADGTGFFLFPDAMPNADPELGPGTYRLELLYRRDNQTHDPGSRVLSQGRDTDPERVTLDVPWDTVI